MAEIPAGCRPYEEDLSSLLDGQLAPEREELVRAHVEACARCREHLAELSQVDLALADLPVREVPAGLRAALDERIASAATGESERPESEDWQALRPSRRRAPAPRRRWMGPALGAALAAAAALAIFLSLPDNQPTRPGAETPTPFAPGPPLPPTPEPGVTPEPVVPDAPSPASGIALEPEAAPAPESVAPEPSVVAPAPDPVVAEVDALPDEQVDAMLDEQVEDLAVALELDTIADFDVIANLDLLERLVALEAEAG